MRSTTTSEWKRVAVLGGDGGDADDGFGVFGVDVEDGDGQALGEVGWRSARSWILRASAVKPRRLLTMTWMVPPTL